MDVWPQELERHEAVVGVGAQEGKTHRPQQHAGDTVSYFVIRPRFLSPPPPTITISAVKHELFDLPSGGSCSDKQIKIPPGGLEFPSPGGCAFENMQESLPGGATKQLTAVQGFMAYVLRERQTTAVDVLPSSPRPVLRCVNHHLEHRA